MNEHDLTAPTDPQVRSALVYTSVQRKLHWWVVVLLMVQWLASQGMVTAMELQSQQATPGAGVFFLSTLHLFSGMSVFCLVLIRVWLRLTPEGRLRRQQDPIQPRWIARLSGLTQVMLYVVLLSMPLSGLMAYFLTDDMAVAAHGYLSRALLALVLLHVLGALFHRVVRKDGIWERMVRISL